MEFSTVLRALVLFGPALLSVAGLCWLTNVLRLWDTWDEHRDTDAIIAYLIGGLAMMYLSIDYSVGIIRTPESDVLQNLAVIVTGCSVLILLCGIYLRVRAFIKARRTSN